MSPDPDARPVAEEQLFRALFANTPDAVFAFSLNDVLLNVNERAVALFGNARGALIGMLTADLIDPAERQNYEAIKLRLLAGETVPDAEFRMRRRDGVLFPAEINLSLVRDDAGEPACFLAIARDTSARKVREQALEASEKLFERVARTMPGVIHILDLTDGHSVYANHELVDILGYEPAEVVELKDRLLETLLHPDDLPSLRNDLARMARAGDDDVIEHQYRVRHADGDWRLLYARSAVFARDEQGAPSQMISVVLDVSERELEARRRRDEEARMRLVNEIATAAMAEMPADTLIAYAVAVLHERFPLLRVAYATVDSGNMLRVVRSVQPPGMVSLEGHGVSLHELPDYLKALTSFQPLVVENVERAPRDRPACAAMGEVDARAILNVPLRHAQGLIGLLCLHAPEPCAWSRSEVETLTECASYLSVAVAAAEQRREREKSEAALRESERRYRTLIDHFPSGAVVLFDHALRFIVAGGDAMTGVGLSVETLEGRTLFEVFPPDIIALLEPYYRTVLAGNACSFESDFRGRFYVTQLIPILDDHGDIMGGLSVISDMTERKQAEAAQRASEQRYRSVIEDQSELFCAFSADYKVRQVNEAYLRYFGLRREEVVGHSFMPNIYQEDRAAVARKLASLGLDRQVVTAEQRWVMPNGEIRWQQWVNRIILDVDGQGVEYQAVGRDVTEQRQAEAALEEKNHLLQTVIDSLPGFIYVRDMEGRYVLDNTAHARSVGLTPAETVGKRDLDLFPPEMAEGFASDDAQVMTTGRSLINREEISLDSDGRPMWALTSKVPLRNSQGEIIGLIGQTHDISERKRAEAELQQERDFTTAILNGTAALMVALDSDCRIISFNRACEQLTGYRAADVVGKTFIDIFVPPDEIEGVRAALNGLTASKPSDKHVNHWRMRDGSRRLIEWSNSLLMGIDGIATHFISSGIDITERQQLEERSLELTLEREKIRILNEFVRNVSHDLRTPLSILNTSLYLMRKVNDPSRHAERLDNMEAQVARLTKLIEQLLTMSRLDNPDEVERKPIDVVVLMQVAVRSFESQAQARGLTLDVDLAPETMIVIGDRPHLGTAIANLLENTLEYTRAHAGVRAYARGSESVLEFWDDGSGIPPEEIPHIFDRFYRIDKARSVDSGSTGLGLAIAEKIVVVHGGRIEVESTLGEGSVFRVLLPLSGG